MSRCSLDQSAAGGAFARYRDIKFIFLHADGATAPLVQRIERLATLDKAVAARMPDGPLAELKRLYFDTATSTGPENLGAILRLVGTALGPPAFTTQRAAHPPSPLAGSGGAKISAIFALAYQKCGLPLPPSPTWPGLPG